MTDPRFHILTAQRDGRWTAWAERADSGERFGVDSTADTEDEARARLEQWLAWQQSHTEALDELQQAERDYHRTVAGSAFVGPTEGPSGLELQKAALARVEAARIRLDAVRNQKPE